MGKDGECFSFSVLIGDPVEIFFPWFIAFEKKNGGFRKSPFEMGIADLLAA